MHYYYLHLNSIVEKIHFTHFHQSRASRELYMRIYFTFNNNYSHYNQTTILIILEASNHFK